MRSVITCKENSDQFEVLLVFSKKRKRKKKKEKEKKGGKVSPGEAT